MKIIIILIAGAAVLIFLKIIRFLITRAERKYSYRKRLTKAFPLIDIIGWTVFVFWGTGFALRDRLYYPYIVIILVLIVSGLIAWFLLRDVFAGAVFRMGNEMNKGDHIETGNVSGQIKTVHITHIEIASDNGQTIRIPYTKLNKDTVSGLTAPGGTEEYKIRCSFEKRFLKPEIEERINSIIANSPWCNYKNPPVIKLLSEDDNTYTYEVLIYTLNHQHHRIAENLLIQKFENLDENTSNFRMK